MIGLTGFGLAVLAANFSPILFIVIFGLTILFLLSYFVLFEAIWGRTIGKFMLGMIVISEDGSKASFFQAVGRTLARFLPFEPFSFFLCEDSSRPLFWHDSLPKTRVVEM